MVVLALLPLFLAPSFDVKFIPSGMTEKQGGYRPIQASMTSAPSGATKGPSDLKAPMYGKFKVGDKEYSFILDEPDGQPSKLFVDADGTGEATQPALSWDEKKNPGGTIMMGKVQLKVDGQLGTLGVYRFDKNDPQRANLKNTLLYYFDFGYEGKATFGKDTYSVSYSGFPGAGTFIWVDRNGNGKSDGRSETIVVGRPFNFKGKTYVVEPKDGQLEVASSTETVAEIPLPPDLSTGAAAPVFNAVATDGSKISFPKSFRGKIVMLDFWATWCGPCIAEMPNVINAYSKFHDKGFEILGISFDQENSADKVAAFTKEHAMPWRQIYEGKYWNTTLGTLYGVEGIPFGLIVDGNTGKVLAGGNAIRGEMLDQTLTKLFANHR